MSERLTNKWTRTAAEAFGGSGERGRSAELFVLGVLRNNGIKADDYEEDYAMQVAGIDIIANNISIDVKGNLYKGYFWIETGSSGWLFNEKKTSDIIVHVDQNTKEIVWYYRTIAKRAIRKVDEKPQSGDNKPLVKIDQYNFRSDFMSRSWDELFTLLRRGV